LFKEIVQDKDAFERIRGRFLERWKRIAELEQKVKELEGKLREREEKMW